MRCCPLHCHPLRAEARQRIIQSLFDVLGVIGHQGNGRDEFGLVKTSELIGEVGWHLDGDEVGLVRFERSYYCSCRPGTVMSDAVHMDLTHDDSCSNSVSASYQPGHSVLRSLTTLST